MRSTRVLPEQAASSVASVNAAAMRMSGKPIVMTEPQPKAAAASLAVEPPDSAAPSAQPRSGLSVRASERVYPPAASRSLTYSAIGRLV
jgi:hypothetical protein